MTILAGRVFGLGFDLISNIRDFRNFFNSAAGLADELFVGGRVIGSGFRLSNLKY